MTKLCTQLYQANWRNIVIAVAAINALRFFFSASNALDDVTLDNLHRVPKLARVSSALGAIYIITAVIQAFGVVSALMQRLFLIRIYTHLSFLSALLITTAGFVSAVSYFLLADDLIHECITLSIIGSHRTKSLFRGKLWKSALPSIKTAQDHCLHAYTNTSPTLPMTLLLFSFLPSVLFFLLAYTYYKQTTDPSHPANLCRSAAKSNPGARSVAPNGVNMRTHAGVRYASIPAAGNNNNTPAQSIDITNAPRGNQARVGAGTAAAGGRKHNSKPIRLQLSPPAISVSPYNITPGPPSFGIIAGAPVARGNGYRSVWFSNAASGDSGDGGKFV